MTCTSDRSGSASIGVVRSAHTRPRRRRTASPAAPGSGWPTDQRISRAIIGRRPCAAPACARTGHRRVTVMRSSSPCCRSGSRTVSTGLQAARQRRSAELEGHGHRRPLQRRHRLVLQRHRCRALIARRSTPVLGDTAAAARSPPRAALARAQPAHRARHQPLQARLGDRSGTGPSHHLLARRSGRCDARSAAVHLSPELDLTGRMTARLPPATNTSARCAGADHRLAGTTSASRAAPAS